VWTGRQALNIGLVDHIGGLNKALNVASSLCDLPPMSTKDYSPSFRVQTYTEPKSGLPFPFGATSGATSSFGSDIQAICDDSVACAGLVSSESLGISPVFNALGLNQLFAYNVAYTAAGNALTKAVQSIMSATSSFSAKNGITDFIDDFF
jgi:ClpP class serine protease